VSGGLPYDSVHRVQRRAGHVPLLRQQVQLLAVDDRPATAVLHTAAGDTQGRQPALPGQSLSGLYQGGPVSDGRQCRRRKTIQLIICRERDKTAWRRRRRSCLKHFRCLCLSVSLSVLRAFSLLLNLFRIEGIGIDAACARRMSFLVVICKVRLKHSNWQRRYRTILLHILILPVNRPSVTMSFC